MRRTFTLAPGIGLVVEAGGLAARHFSAEYGHGPQPGAPPVMWLSVGPTTRAGRSGATSYRFVGGHRLARWLVRVRMDASATSVSCALRVAGPLGLPLVQSMVVEPLLSLATPTAGRVLLPGALVEAADGPVLVLGASGTGKSTLALRALAAGRPVAADDQILVRGDGLCCGLSRRLRVYAELAAVVPEAHAMLPSAVRRRVALAAAVRRVSGGLASPPVPVSPAVLDAQAWRPGRDVDPVRALVLTRGSARARLGADELVACALELLAQQRARLVAAGIALPAATRDREAAILAGALGRLHAERADIRGAADPLGALERSIGA